MNHDVFMYKDPSSPKKLFPSAKDKKIFGVCGGIAEYFGADATIVRLAWVLLTIMTGIFPGILTYLMAAIIMPKKAAF